MNETTVLKLIAKGETSTIDFKESLSLDKAHPKAELIKDILSIANTTTSEGYLLVGVDDDGRIIGIDSLDEERIQQIVRKYISPPVRIICDVIPIASVGFLKVGVISILATKQPHKVARDIDKLTQDTVFLRHGSVITKASPEEIIQMHDNESNLHRDSRQYVKAAETHCKLGNYERAIDAYSKAIDLTPSPTILVARAETYFAWQRSNIHHKSYWTWGAAAMKDLNDAIILSESDQLTKQTRKLRRKNARFFGHSTYTEAQRNEDFEFEKSQLSGKELGEWIYNEVRHWDVIFGTDEKSLSLIEEAIQTGYENPKLYFLLAEAHYGMANFGLAFKEVERLLNENKITDNDFLVELLCFRANVLVEMGKFIEARDTLIRAEELSSDSVRQYLSLLDLYFYHSILCKYMLAWEFGNNITFPMNLVIRFLVLALSRKIESLETSIENDEVLEWKSGLDYLERKFPGIKKTLREYLGEEDWNDIEDPLSRLATSVNFPSIQEAIEKIIETRRSYISKGKKKYHIS